VSAGVINFARSDLKSLAGGRGGEGGGGERGAGGRYVLGELSQGPPFASPGGMPWRFVLRRKANQQTRSSNMPFAPRDDVNAQLQV
jgi:hypothetical protein